MNIYYKYNYIILINILLHLKNNKIYNLNFNLKNIKDNNINNIINFFNMLYDNIDSDNLNYNIIYNNLINLIKYGNKKDCLNKYIRKKFFTIINFANTNNVNLNKIKVHNDSYYYLTNYYDSNFINTIIYKKFKTKNLIITDGTAHVGGNTISFALFKFKIINAVEINHNYYKYLINNIKCYNLKNIKLLNDSYLNVYDKLYQDILFLDPPWGGPSYKSIKNLDLYLDNVNIVKIVNNVFSETKTKAVLLKVPYNYNLDLLKKKNNNLIIKTFFLKKFQIIFLCNF